MPLKFTSFRHTNSPYPKFKEPSKDTAPLFDVIHSRGDGQSVNTVMFDRYKTDIREVIRWLHQNKPVGGKRCYCSHDCCACWNASSGELFGNGSYVVFTQDWSMNI